MGRYISEVIEYNDIRRHMLNLLIAGCGAGKTEWCINRLADHYGYKDSEVLYVTSRSIIAETVAMNDRAYLFNPEDHDYANYMNGVLQNTEAIKDVESKGIAAMNYGQFINIITKVRPMYGELFKNIKVFIFDEVHAVFADSYIWGMDFVQFWMHMEMMLTDKLIIGMTATPEIIDFKNKTIPINKLIYEDIPHYRAANLTCMRFSGIPQILKDGTLQGKTIIMCQRISDCKQLAKELSNACVICSRSSEEYDPVSMEKVRRTIAFTGKLPETFDRLNEMTGEVFSTPLDYLITTTTLREGFTLRKDSGVRNVICCLNDSLNITQFLGRCRYNIDNLIIAPKTLRFSNKEDTFFQVENNKYIRYINGFDMEWQDSIRHLVSGDIAPTLTPEYTDRRNFIDEFREYIGNGVEMTPEDQNYWSQQAIDVGYMTGKRSFTKLKNKLLKDFPEYEIELNRGRVDGEIQRNWTIKRKADYSDEDVCDGLTLCL